MYREIYRGRGESPVRYFGKKTMGGETEAIVVAAPTELPEEKLSVVIHEICYVRPPASSSSQYLGTQLYLSSLDLFWRQFHYNRRLLFYNSPPSSLTSFDTILDSLKLTLSQALLHFYPLSGRLSTQPDGRSCILCDDQGVQFVVASADAPLPTPLDSTDFAPSPFFDKLVQMSVVDLAQINDLPLLSIQVTKFRCGGFAVGYAHSHVVADGHSMWHFMNSWAQLARGQPLSLPPTHDRTFFRVSSPSPDIALRLNLPPAREDPDGGADSRSLKTPPPDPLDERLFHLSGAAVDALKRRAGGGRISSFAALSAHWWKHVMAARRLDDDETVLFAVLADMRQRVTPPLPPSYFGNAIMFAFAQSTYGELKRMDGARAAELIAGASRQCDEARMWAKIHWLEIHGNMFGRRLLWRGKHMTVASSPKFDVYGVDFGWGRPAAVRTAKVKGDGELVLFQGAAGGIDVCMALERRSMERLLLRRRFLRLDAAAAAAAAGDLDDEE